MANPSNLNDIIQCIFNGSQSDEDVEALRQGLNSGGSQNLQVGKYNVNIGQGQDIHIGDRIYQGLDAEAIQEVTRAVTQGYNAVHILEKVEGKPQPILNYIFSIGLAIKDLNPLDFVNSTSGESVAKC